ncbi:MAG: hypothetical protein LBI74_04720, partial [Synergistaceae bacterium]|nr:hypothetical protein [Synergistaceae bacterium]
MSTWSCGASRRVAAAFALAMFVSGLFFPVFPLGGTAWAADDSLNIEMRAILKADVAMEETDLEAEKAKSNVLFMIDSTIPMSFAPKSVMPTVVLASGWVNTYGESADWNATYNVYRHTISDVIRMMSGSTFGMGALPTAWYKGNVTMERNLYGRDVDPSNRFISTGTVEGDIEANKNNYYFPFTSKYPDQVAALKGAYQSQIDPLLTSYTLYKAATHNSNSAHYNLQTDSSNWNKWAGEENGYPVISYGTGYSAAVSSGNSYPYALVFKNPAWWKTGPPSGATAAQIEAELVPNDSRMYQTKLVLWNLLENESLFKNLRFGLATTFLNPINGSGEVTDYSPRHHAGLNIHNPGHGLYTRYDFHGVFKVFPFGANTYSRSSGRPQFVNGVSIQAVSGHMRGYTALHGTYYPMWALQTVETNYSNLRTSNRSTADRNEAELVYRMEHRGSLWLPIRDYGATWKGSFSGATRPTMKHADRFRQWINGLGDIAWTSTVSRNGQYHFYKDPEIGIAGVGLLPMAIYPDPRPGLYLSREYYKGPYFKFGTKAKDGAIFYSYKDYNRDWTLDYYMGSTELENPELNTRMLTNAGSGEAAGSILDFFTPPAGYTSVAGTALGSYLADVSYAVRDVNEDNWVILITSGQEVKPEGDGYAYTTADAIKNLYDATNAARSKDVRTGYTAVMDHNRIYAPYERVMEMPRNADDTKLCEPRIRDLKNPIKTLVVGIVANPLSFDVGSTERRDATEMRANIAKMAKAGQPDNPSAAPFFADNVESLTIALRDALITIGEEREMQSGKGQMMVSTIDDRMGNRGEEIDFSVYSGTYRIRYNDQWEGELRRYDVSQDVSGNMTLYEKWELGKIISGDTVNNKRGANRQLKYWIGKDGATPGKFTSPDQAHDVWKWIGLAAGDRIQPKAAGKPEYTDSLMEWFRGTDRSYLDGFDYFTRGSMLAELSTHGVVMATRPPTGKSLPGYEAWANSKSTDVTMRSKIYAHTNDGVLHLLDAADGDEEMAILPPPMLLPTRLATLKTNVVSQTKPYLRWISSSMPEGQSGALRSNPVYLLDGALQVRRFDMGSGGVYSEGTHNWGTYLLGALGKGGRGLYMLDVTDHGSPKFKWYREKADAYLLSMDQDANHPTRT